MSASAAEQNGRSAAETDSSRVEMAPDLHAEGPIGGRCCA